MMARSMIHCRCVVLDIRISKLFEWTNQRWIITLSKKKGEISKKENLKNQNLKIYDDFKNSEDYRKILNIFEDAKINNIDEN